MDAKSQVRQASPHETPIPIPGSSWREPGYLAELLSDPAGLVVRRPHFRLEGTGLYFMASSRPHAVLSAAELELWGDIAQPTPLLALRERFGDRADAVVRSLWRNELCEIVEQDPLPERRRILVVEPHPDDAALSVGGTLWLRRRECEFTIATIASRSNYTSYYNLERDYFDADAVAALRGAESRLFSDAVRGRHIAVGRTDAALRGRESRWSLDYFRRNRMAIAAATGRAADEQELAAWVETITKLFSEVDAEEIWMPLGASHCDHQLTVNACIAACVAAPSLIERRVVKIYQDVPYAARTPDFSAEMLSALARLGVRLEPESMAIDGVFEQKLRLVSLYASQFKIAAMRRDIEASARSNGNLVERLWTVRSLPPRLRAAEIRSLSEQEQQQQRESEGWFARNRAAAKIRILLLVPTGRWKQDLSKLRLALPEARFEVYATPAAVAELSEEPSAAVMITEVRGGARAWAALALRLLAAKPMPTLFHSGPGRIGVSKRLAALWLLSDTLVVPSMNPVIRAIQKESTDRQGDAADLPA